MKNIVIRKQNVAYCVSGLYIYKFVIFIISSLYAFLLSIVPMVGIADRANYIEMASSSPIILLRFIADGYLSFLTNEPLWFTLNSFIGLFFEAETVVRIFIFFSAFMLSYRVLAYKPSYFIILLLILIAPQVIKNFVIHIRQGVGIAFFVWGWFSQNRYVKYGFILTTPFIHSSFFIVITLLLSAKLLQKSKLGADLRLAIYIFTGVVITLLISGLSQALGARQATEISTVSNVSGMAFLYWSLLLCLCLCQGKNFIKEYSFTLSAIFLYLVMYFLTPLAGRIFESSVVIILLSALSLTGWRKLVFITAFCLFTLLSLISHIQQPMFGFSAA